MEGHMIGRIFGGLGMAALLAGAAALAEPSTAGDPALKSSKGDPNRMICRSMNEGGSRLDRARACHTAAEWAELRRQTRATIDHIQTTRPGSY
jgi:hypothetical protein